MAGSPPPPDFPSPESQDIVTANASFAPGPDAKSICGFKFPPKFNFGFGFNLPPLPLPFKIPTLDISFAINCDLDNPFSFSAGLKSGGGRVASYDLDDDERDTALAMKLSNRFDKGSQWLFQSSSINQLNPLAL